MSTIPTKYTATVVALCLALGGTASAQAPVRSPAGAPTAEPAKPFVIEYYYKVRWGALDEWLALYKKNHYPVLLEVQKQGTILGMSAATPVNHAGEDKRWDFRFTIVYRDAIAAHGKTDPAVIRRLFPDQATFLAEEKRRFELLVEHMDIPVALDDLTTWR